MADTSTLELDALDLNIAISPLKNFMNALPFYRWLIEHSHLVQLARQTAIRWFSRPSSAVGGTQVDTEPALLLAKGIYRRMNRWCEDHGARLIVVTTGVQNHFFRMAEELNHVAPVDAVFAEQRVPFLSSEGIPFKDISDAVEAAMNDRIQDYLIPLDSHIDEAGAMIIAEQAWPFLRRQFEQFAESPGR